MHYLNRLSKKSDMSLVDLHILNITRIGMQIDNTNIFPKFAVNFRLPDGQIIHKPTDNSQVSPYKITDGNIHYNGKKIDLRVGSFFADIPTEYYFRSPKLLVLNASQNGKCGEMCVFCEETVLNNESRYSIKMNEPELYDKIQYENNLSDLSHLDQITLLVSCSGNEEKAINTYKKYRKEAEKRGFEGIFLYGSNEIRTHEGLKELASMGNVIYAFTVECFEDRERLMPGKKGKIKLPEIKDILSTASSLGIESTYFYIVGLDSLDGMREGFEFLRDAVELVPTTPTFQRMGKQTKIPLKSLRYFVEAHKIFNTVHKGMVQLESIQTFRSLNPSDISLERRVLQ